MKVKVTWVSNNPFVLDLRNMSRCGNPAGLSSAVDRC